MEQRMNTVLIGILTILFSFQVSAELISGKMIKVESEIPSWNATFEGKAKNKYNGLTECREVQEIPSAHLCLSYKQSDMNLALARTAFFVEGTVSGVKGNIVPHNDSNLLRYLKLFGGHDLRAEDLLAFYEAAQSKCSASKYDRNICLNDQELELYEDYVLPKIKRNANFVIITYSLISNMKYQDVVTHEILHAQYFTNFVFKETTDHFWDEQVSSSDKLDIIAKLSRHYNSNDDYLMRNEFQAYLLQAKAENGMLAMFVNKYQKLLIQALALRGLKPVLIF
jgi:hypothetical protein